MIWPLDLGTYLARIIDLIAIPTKLCSDTNNTIEIRRFIFNSAKQMDDILLISWSIGVIGAVIGMAGGIYFLLSLRVMGEQIKKSMFYMFLGSFIWTVYSIVIIFYAFLEVDITNKLWIIIPISYTFASIGFIIGTSRLMRFFEATHGAKWKK